MKKKSLWLILLFVGILFIDVSVSARELNLNILDTSSAVSCSGYFGNANTEGTLMYVLKHNIFTPVQVAAPIILLVFTTIDFSKVVFSDGKDGMDKAKKNFIKRAIMAVIIFFIPTILGLVFSLVDNAAIRSCMSNFS